MGVLDRTLTFGGMEERPNRARRLVGMSAGLFYLFYPASEIVNGDFSPVKRVWAVIALCAFTASFVGTALSPKAYGRASRTTMVLLAVTTAMALSFPLIFSGVWFALPVYVTVILGMGLPPRRALVGIVALAAVTVAEAMATGADFGSIAPIVVQIIALGVMFISIANTRGLVVQLRQAQQEVARLAASEERLRIARDLHDLLGHSLSLIVLKSELAGRLAEQGSVRSAEEIRDIESVARKALVEVREAVTGYRQRGLSEELDNARAALEAAGVRVTVSTSGTPLPDQLDGLFGWAVREGVTNVMRHARATRCEIAVTFDGVAAALEITDNGRGADECPPEPGAAPHRPGSGLVGLTERVTSAGGTVGVGPRPGGGFRLRVRVAAEIPVDSLARPRP
jgi:two-component system sensor histidine kinase DesK